MARSILSHFNIHVIQVDLYYMVDCNQKVPSLIT